VLFTGYAELTVDAKGRLAIPAKHRKGWNPDKDGSAWYCVPWPGGKLRLYTEGRFERMAEQAEDSLTPNPDQAELDVNLFSEAERLEPDAQNRVLLPKRHIQRAQLPTEVVVVGARNRLEIWSRQAWAESQDERFERMPGLVERIEARHRADTTP